MTLRNLAYILCVTMAPFVNAQATTTFLYTQPYIYSITPILANNPTAPGTPGVAQIRTYDVGITNQIPNWDVAAFTGLNIPASNRQDTERTVDANWPGSTAVQAYMDNIAFQLHTYSSPFVSGRYLKTINIEYNFPVTNTPAPWSGQYGSDAKLCMGFFAAVPSSWNGEGSENYAGANFFFRDIITNKFFTIGSIFFTTQSLAEYIGFDGGQGGTNMPMVVTYYGSQNYITTSNYSASTRTATWNDEPWFGFCLTRQNIQNIVNQINTSYPGNNFSISNLGLGAASIGAEIFTGSNGLNNGHMATRVKEWNIFIEH